MSEVQGRKCQSSLANWLGLDTSLLLQWLKRSAIVCPETAESSGGITRSTVTDTSCAAATVDGAADHQATPTALSMPTAEFSLSELTLPYDIGLHSIIMLINYLI